MDENTPPTEPYFIREISSRIINSEGIIWPEGFQHDNWVSRLPTNGESWLPLLDQEADYMIANTVQPISIAYINDIYKKNHT